jgi:hypothetical protein
LHPIFLNFFSNVYSQRNDYLRLFQRPAFESYSSVFRDHYLLHSTRRPNVAALDLYGIVREYFANYHAGVCGCRDCEPPPSDEFDIAHAGGTPSATPDRQTSTHAAPSATGRRRPHDEVFHSGMDAMPCVTAGSIAGAVSVVALCWAVILPSLLNSAAGARNAGASGAS